MPEKIILDVLFRSASGRSLLESEKELTVEELSQYSVKEETREQALRALGELGFEIVGPASPFGVSITGSPELVKKMFGEELEVPVSLRQWVESVRMPPPVEFYTN